MILLKTEKVGTRNRYVRIDTDAKGREIFHRECELRIVTTYKDGVKTFSVLDEEGHTNRDVHKYVNIKMVNDCRSDNSRHKAAQVLCKFYAFIYLMGYTSYNLGQDEIYQLVAFFQGKGPSQCSNNTVNAYLAILRCYFSCIGIRCDALFHQRVVVRNDVSKKNFGVENTYRMYDVNLPRNPHQNERVPKFITLDQYVALQKLARKKGDWNGVMLMHLMFRYGMRLGECLGLTEEDLSVFRINGNDIPTLIIRNRLSDAPYQRAKRKLTPQTKEDYENASYINQWKKDDYSHYYLTESAETDFVVAFEKFIAQSRENALKEHPVNYRSSEADIVCPEEFKRKGLKKNHYIFVNRLGKRLSAQYWGNVLKGYFIELGIPLDKGKKENNLSHRFRHGFAMAHARSMDPPVPVEKLKMMMHHRDISSTLIYYNPTIEDEYEYKTLMQNRYFDDNQELKDIISSFLNDGNDAFERDK